MCGSGTGTGTSSARSRLKEEALPRFFHIDLALGSKRRVRAPGLPAKEHRPVGGVPSRGGGQCARCGLSFCRGRVGWGKRLRIDHRARFRFLQAFHHDAVAGIETAFNDPIRAKLLADFDGLQADGIGFVHDRHLIGALHFRHGALRHEQCVRDRMRLGAHPRRIGPGAK